jgi:hypothetical protein
MAGMEALARLVDLSVGIAPVDLSAAAVTGKRVALKRASGLMVVLFKGAASSGTDPALTFKEATLATGGTSQNMVTPPAYFWQKTGAALAGTEVWTQVTATYASGVQTLTGQQGNQGIFVWDILSEDLSAGFSYIEVDASKAGTVAQLGAVLLIPHDLLSQRYPSNLAAATA